MMKYAVLSRFKKKKKNLAQDPPALIDPDTGVDHQLEEYCSFFPLHQLKKATNNFEQAAVLGTGGFGQVYKGNLVLDDGATATTTVNVGIKRLRANSTQGHTEFWAEVRVLAKFRHTNLISLVGYCHENNEMILVYEYMAQGNLADHLYKTRGRGGGSSRSHLTWEQRLKICHGAALGLEYLHNGGIVHRDVKSTNILLDDCFVAKVSDFGLSKSESPLVNTTSVQGTVGYMDPSFYSTCRLTKKSDVYSFGVVLLEVLCARPPLDGRLDDMEQKFLTNWAQMNITKGKLERIIDPSLNGDASPDSLKYFAELAIKCSHIQSEERPKMAEVVESLQIALVLHQSKGISQGIVEQGGPEVVNATITLDDIRRLYGRMNREDAAACLDISVSTFKRKCREYGIKRWPHTRKKEVRRPPHQHGERNTSTACKTPSDNLQTGEKSTSKAGEAPSRNLETGANVFRQYFTEPIGQNQEANVFPQYFTEGPFSWNTENCLITGSSSEWASQVIDQSTVSAPHPNQDALVFPDTQMDWRNSLASQAESFPDIHISGSSNLAFPTCSDQGAPSQSVQVQSMQYIVYPDDNALVFPHSEIVSLQEPFPEGHVFNPIRRNEHTNIVTIKAFYGDTVLKFLFPLASGIVDLKNEVSKRLNVAVDRFEVKYKDKYEHLISIPCNEDWMLYLSSSLENEEIRVFVLDKVGGNSNS